MKILVTGFDPFGTDSINPASEVLTHLPKEIKGATIHTLVLPTVFHKSADVLSAKMDELQPDVVLNIGQAGGRTAMTPERVAINLDDARIPDNENNQPIDQPIQTDGPAAYFSTLPIKAMVEAMKDSGIPAMISNSAGTFVCNHIMYQTRYLIERKFPQTIGGFIHIPFMTEQVVNQPSQPSMSLVDITKGITLSLEAIIDHFGQDDLKIIGGTIH